MVSSQRREEWEQARSLLEESVSKAWHRLDCLGPHASQSSQIAEIRRLDGALAAARQLLARPDTRTEDLLEYLADLETAMQLLATLTASDSGSSNQSIVAKSSSVSPEIAAARVVATAAPMTLAQASAAAEVLESMSDHGRQLQLLEWQEWEEEDSIERKKRLSNLALEAASLATAQREVAQLAASFSDPFDRTASETSKAAVSSNQAVREIGVAARSSLKGLPLKASLSGAAIGAAVGVCVAGPLGAVVGAGATAALGAFGGSSIQKHQLQTIDRIIATSDQSS